MPYSQNIRTHVPTGAYAPTVARTSACLLHPSHPYWGSRRKPFRLQPKLASLNFSQCVEGRRWGPEAREGLEEARVFVGDEPCNGEQRHRTSARCDALQSVRNGAICL
jgi:hypothetical protein